MDAIIYPTYHNTMVLHTHLRVCRVGGGVGVGGWGWGLGSGDENLLLDRDGIIIHSLHFILWLVTHYLLLIYLLTWHEINVWFVQLAIVFEISQEVKQIISCIFYVYFISYIITAI